jgi:hypothetical protein
MTILFKEARELIECQVIQNIPFKFWRVVRRAEIIHPHFGGQSKYGFRDIVIR